MQQKPFHPTDIIRWLYSVLLVPVALTHLLFMRFTHSAYNQRSMERLGWLPQPKKTGGFLFHCVSVGEVVAASALIKAIMRQHPDAPITVTTTTPTGSARVKAIFADRVIHFYLPYDMPMAMNRMLSQIKPEKVIITEVELWPNLIHTCWKKGISTYVINARMTDNSARSYRKVHWLFRPMLTKLTAVCTQGERDQKNYLELGMPAEKCIMTNNIKFDLKFDETTQQKADAIEQQWQLSYRESWIAGSTHDPEEQVVLQAHKQLLKKHAKLLLVLVPRYPHRFDKIFNQIESMGLSVQRISGNGPIRAETQVLLADEMGQLSALYSLVNYAFVGGSIANRGGHNPLEAAICATPAMMGPSIYNNPVICQALVDAGAVVKTDSADKIAEQLAEWLANPECAKKAGEIGIHIVKENQGAVENTLTVLFG